MSGRTTNRRGLTVVGAGAGVAACAACCAAPGLAVLGGVGVAGLAATVVVGAAGLLLAAGVLAAVVLRRRRAGHGWAAALGLSRWRSPRPAPPGRPAGARGGSPRTPA